MDYSIQNQDLIVRVSTRGAELQSIKTALGQELIWQGNPAVWPRHSPVCFPWCGKVQDGWFMWRGHRQSAPTQHGFVRDLEHEMTAQTENSVSFRLDYPGDPDGWLWPFAFETTHALQGKALATTCVAENCGKEAMPVQLGFHPGFICPFEGDSSLESYRVSFESGRVIPLHKRMFDNDSIAFEDAGAWVRLEHVPTGKYLEVSTAGFPKVLLWSKPGIPDFICIEPWCGYSGPHHDLTERPETVILEPGERRSWTLRIFSAI